MGNKVLGMCKIFKGDQNSEFDFEDGPSPNVKSHLPKITEEIIQEDENKEFEIILSYIGRYIDENEVLNKLSQKVKEIEQKLGTLEVIPKTNKLSSFSKDYILFNEDQSIYKGDWINWNSNYEKHGHGILISHDGSKFEGNWEHDEICGYGRYISCAGTYYEGIDFLYLLYQYLTQ